MTLVDDICAGLVTKRDVLAMFAVRIALYATAFFAFQVSQTIGEIPTALIIAATFLLSGSLLIPTMLDDIDVAITVAVVLIVGSVLVVIELISVWRGLWSYAPSANTTNNTKILDRANTLVASAWAWLYAIPWVPKYVSLPYIGRERVPVWLWPCWLLVILATLDIERTLESVIRAIFHTERPTRI